MKRESVLKVRVDLERCQGHTLCAMRAPRSFELDDIDGHSVVISEEVPADQEISVAGRNLRYQKES